MPRPLDSTVSHSNDPQLAQAGRGGCRNVPHEVQRWIKSWCSCAPSNQNALSWVSAGCGRGGRAGLRSGGRNLRMRKRIVATGSPASNSARTCSSVSARRRPASAGPRAAPAPAGTEESGTATYSCRVVRKRPIPRPVRFGSEIDSITERTSRRSPDHQRSPVRLLAVGRHDRGETLVVEQLHHAVAGPVALGRAGRPGRLDLVGRLAGRA